MRDECNGYSVHGQQPEPTSLCISVSSLACWVSMVLGSREYRLTLISFLPSSLYLTLRWNKIQPEGWAQICCSSHSQMSYQMLQQKEKRVWEIFSTQIILRTNNKVREQRTKSILNVGMKQTTQVPTPSWRRSWFVLKGRTAREQSYLAEHLRLLSDKLSVDGFRHQVVQTGGVFL